MVNVLQEFIEILVGGLTSMATGIGSGIQSAVTAFFLSGNGTDSSPYTLSVLGGVIAIFAGISLAVGLTKMVYHLIASAGATGK